MNLCILQSMKSLNFDHNLSTMTIDRLVWEFFKNALLRFDFVNKSKFLNSAPNSQIKNSTILGRQSKRLGGRVLVLLSVPEISREVHSGMLATAREGHGRPLPQNWFGRSGRFRWNLINTLKMKSDEFLTYAKHKQMCIVDIILLYEFCNRKKAEKRRSTIQWIDVHM